MVEDVVDYCAGLDVHRDTVVATVRFPEGNRRCSVTKTFGTDTAELVALGDWLISQSVTRVGLESTGVYWKPVFYQLEERIAQVWLLNAQHLKNVPGRKMTWLIRRGSPNWSSMVWSPGATWPTAGGSSDRVVRRSGYPYPGMGMGILVNPATVPAGTVSLQVRNTGTLTHRVVVLPLAQGRFPGQRLSGLTARSTSPTVKAKSREHAAPTTRTASPQQRPAGPPSPCP